MKMMDEMAMLKKDQEEKNIQLAKLSAQNAEIQAKYESKIEALKTKLQAVIVKKMEAHKNTVDRAKAQYEFVLRDILRLSGDKKAMLENLKKAKSALSKSQLELQESKHELEKMR